MKYKKYIQGDTMRTTLNIDDTLLEEARLLTGNTQP
ncbi:MAG: hypothetical protein D3909_15735, partial [Candidatus Electrothrix sp. ATG1]|nr:hypothetical protein [Candidatus Electrothrix sp. ATG1]